MTATKRPYTGNKVLPARHKQPGLEYLVRALIKYSGGAFQNWGTHVIRNKKGKSSVSVHARGTAVDLGYNKTKKAEADRWITLILQYADELGIEAVFDYNPKPHGRGWKCDRNKWETYTKKAFDGAPGGNWYHIEVSVAAGKDEVTMKREFHKLLADLKAAVPASPTTPQ
jgi:hypothetical protein